MAMATATRLLPRSFRRPPPPLRPPASLSRAGLLHGSVPAPHIPNIRWFGAGSRQYSSSSKTAPPCRRILENVLFATFISTSASAAVLDLKLNEYKNDEENDEEDNDKKEEEDDENLYEDEDNDEEDDHEDDERKEEEDDDEDDDEEADDYLYNDEDDNDYLYEDDDVDDQEPPPGRERIGREKRKWTDVLIALNLLVHGVDVVTNRKLLLWGIMNNELIRRGQLWRLATPSFLHGGMIHITCNMLALDAIGSMMEEVTGHRRFLAVYCTSGLAGSLMSCRFSTVNSIGASGAICGLIGACAVYTWRHRESLEKPEETLKDIGQLILLNLGISLLFKIFKIRIDDWAHLGGLLGGAAAEWFLGPNGRQHVANDGTVALGDKSPVLSR